MNKFLKKNFFISFIIPCYNCQTFIEKNIIRLIKKLKNHGIKYEIILVNDGSKDKTNIILKKLNSNFKNLRVFENKINKGKSYSVIYGIKKARGKKIIIFDCDLPYYSYLDKVITKLHKYKLVIIDRKDSRSKILLNNLSIYQFFRHTVGTLISILNNFFFNLGTRDTQAGLKGFYKIKDFRKIKFVSKKFFFDLELILFFKNKNIFPCSIPVKFKIPDNSNIKFMNLKKNFEIIAELIKVIKKYKN